MSNIIKANGQPILICSNPLLNIFYKSLLSETNQFEHKNLKITQLIQDLDQENVGLGCVSIDIANYGFDKGEVLVLIDLVTSAIEHMRTTFLVDDIAIMILENFAEKLVKYN